MEGKNMEMMVNVNNGYTYVFEAKEEDSGPSAFRRKIWQIFPTVCGSMMCLPFGIMLGWPSPTYPTLTDPTKSPIPISLDQSAMIAGALMIGNVITTPISSNRRFGAKYGIIFGLVLSVCGWIIMWQAKNIFWLLGSRLLVGMGNGYGTGQLKIYISEICQQDLAPHMIKQINCYIFSGVIMAFAFGPFVDFKQFGIIAVIITIFVLFLAIFLPSTPRELVSGERVSDAKKLIAFLSPHVDVLEEIANIKAKMTINEEVLTFCDIIKDNILRRKLLVFLSLVFFQQTTGAPATIIYSQILFTKSHCPNPVYCALAYSIVFLLANIVGIFYSPRYNKKSILIFSSFSVTIMLIIKILVLLKKLNETQWGYTSLIVMFAFIIFHTIGLGNIPFTLIPDLFPKSATKVIVHAFIMLHCMLALIITKIFQVLFDRLGLFTPFCLFLIMSTFALVFIIIFVPQQKKQDQSAVRRFKSFSLNTNPKDLDINA